jgi:hypothetical protein
VHVPAYALGERSVGVRTARAEPRCRLAVGTPCGSKAPPVFEPAATLGLLLDAMSRTSRSSPHLAASKTFFQLASLWGLSSNFH